MSLLFNEASDMTNMIYYYLVLMMAFLVIATWSISFASLQELKAQCALGGRIYRRFLRKYIWFVYGFTIMFSFYIGAGYFQLNFYTEVMIECKEFLNGIQVESSTSSSKRTNRLLAGGALISILLASLAQMI